MSTIRLSLCQTKKKKKFTNDESNFVGQKQVNQPSALDKFEKIINTSMGNQIVLFLDYSGTFSPIVDDSDRAFMLEHVSSCLFGFIHMDTRGFGVAT